MCPECVKPVLLDENESESSSLSNFARKFSDHVPAEKGGHRKACKKIADEITEAKKNVRITGKTKIAKTMKVVTKIAKAMKVMKAMEAMECNSS